ncbi:hypothetical protein Nepgr_019964 [Nepenthes gracilis]|uniref:Amino acid transporter transmembrane domain-containing protein n=1 Tax=Nepenthes gracilis TaxID=150966 RepID=A0AAD3SUB0_NEPGR|nr:hypothetical protein Nepgr_019964 [Nepenthes gracilis]
MLASCRSVRIQPATDQEAPPLPQRESLQIEGLSEAEKQFSKLEAWLPLTESRNGNIYRTFFHLVNSGIGTQALVLPVALTHLGWAWGIICFLLAFSWQLYTIWLLVHLHESPSGKRYSRYLQLAVASFGPKLGKLLAVFPVMYQSGGTCANLIINAGGILKLLFRVICDEGDRCNPTAVSDVEWYLVFVFIAIVIAQHPNLNSLALVSLVGTITAAAYCYVIWIVPVSRSRPSGVFYGANKGIDSETTRAMGVLSAFGTIAFAFRGHNLVLEIQGTLPTSLSNPCRKTMWRAVTRSYCLIASCLIPLAIAGYWAYGNLIPTGGMLTAYPEFHGHGAALAVMYFLVIIACLCSFQLYAMPVFDNLEIVAIGKRGKACEWWLRAGMRCFFGGLVFFGSVALPFLPKLAALIGGIGLPLTFVYPCFMWIAIKKPRSLSPMWWLNWVLGCSGVVVSVLVVISAIWNLAKHGLDANFFHPR